jgi:hypothetical protein
VENLNDSKNINGTLKNIKDDIKTSAEDSQNPYKLKKHKPWFGKKKCFRVLDQKKQVKVEWLQDPKQSNADSLNIASREARRHIRNKNSEYLITKTNDLESNNKTKNSKVLYRGSNGFK